VSKNYKFQDYEAIWQNSQASGNDLLLLLALVKFRQPKGMFATRETLALMLRCNVDTVDRSLKRLKALGELTWDKGSSYSRRANRYSILLPGLDLLKNSPLNASRNSQEKPLETHEESPLNINALNSNETVVKREQEVLKFDSSRFGELHIASIESSGLPPLQVEHLLSNFSDSWECRKAYTEKVRLDRWWEFLDRFAASQAEGNS
jgi:hypothetical protein